jgi:hypothetical protein
MRIRFGYRSPVAGLGELTTMFREFAAVTSSPLYASLAATTADHREIVELLAAAPATQHAPVLLFAAVHDILLREPDHPLAAWYPNIVGEARSDDPALEFVRFCHTRADELRAITATRSTQTNEIGRCAFFLPALHRVAAEVGDLSLLDVGSSAGLNLLIDRFDYVFDPGGELRTGSPVVLEAGTRGPVPVPRSYPSIISRLGIDRSPIDITDGDEARWLEACIWPDQVHRFERLAGAIAIARTTPPPVIAGDAVDDLIGAIDRLDPNGHPVVMNSWVLSYLTQERRDLYVAELDLAGSTRDLTWVFAESPSLTPGLPVPTPFIDSQQTELVAVRWRDRRRTSHHLARVHPHGRWLQWDADD